MPQTVGILTLLWLITGGYAQACWVLQISPSCQECLSTRVGSRDAAGEEAATGGDGTTAILDWHGRLAQADSE